MAVPQGTGPVEDVDRPARPPPARDLLLDRLWPEEDPSKAASRLSVTLSTLRAVLDPDKRFEAEHFVANDRAAAWLRLENVSVDVEQFLAEAAAGLRALGDDAAAARLLASAEARYRGDFLEEDPYEDAFAALREEAHHLCVGCDGARRPRARRRRPRWRGAVPPAGAGHSIPTTSGPTFILSRPSAQPAATMRPDGCTAATAAAWPRSPSNRRPSPLPAILPAKDDVVTAAELTSSTHS